MDGKQIVDSCLDKAITFQRKLVQVCPQNTTFRDVSNGLENHKHKIATRRNQKKSDMPKELFVRDRKKFLIEERERTKNEIQRLLNAQKLQCDMFEADVLEFATEKIDLTPYWHIRLEKLQDNEHKLSQLCRIILMYDEFKLARDNAKLPADIQWHELKRPLKHCSIGMFIKFRQGNLLFREMVRFANKQ